MWQSSFTLPDYNDSDVFLQATAFNPLPQLPSSLFPALILTYLTHIWARPNKHLSEEILQYRALALEIMAQMVEPYNCFKIISQCCKCDNPNICFCNGISKPVRQKLSSHLHFWLNLYIKATKKKKKTVIKNLTVYSHYNFHAVSLQQFYHTA